MDWIHVVQDGCDRLLWTR